MFFFFNDPAPTEISTLSLHDALPIYDGRLPLWDKGARLVVFADDPQLAKKVAAEIAKKAYWSSSYFSGTFADLENSQLRIHSSRRCPNGLPPAETDDE